MEIERKAVDRQKSIQAQIDVTDYDAGAFY